MKILTKNFMGYVVICSLIILASRLFMGYFLKTGSNLGVLTTALIWGISLFGIGWYFGKRQMETLPFVYTGVIFHIATYILFALLSILYFKLRLNAPQENTYQLFHTLLWWGLLGLVMHTFYFFKHRQQTIKGLDKSEIFE